MSVSSTSQRPFKLQPHNLCLALALLSVKPVLLFLELLQRSPHPAPPQHSLSLGGLDRCWAVLRGRCDECSVLSAAGSAGLGWGRRGAKSSIGIFNLPVAVRQVLWGWRMCRIPGGVLGVGEVSHGGEKVSLLSVSHYEVNICPNQHLCM